MAQKFGTYELIEKIGDGGMAEVFLAKHVGDLAGFEKQVALKRIFPHLTDREELVVMFLDEARISAQLNHPNIVQVYDLGKVDDTLYIAMEYVHGNDLRDICERGVAADNPLSRPLAARIVAEAAGGLHHAHTSTDEQGNPHNIVHRDVSPQNILVGMDGQVKVVDFGVAKAENRLGKTQIGQRKGKLAYMSPEQFDAKTVDARSDVYTLGIVLYETTVRQRLFVGRSEFETMNMVANAVVDPPSERCADFPAGLEAVILKALHRDPDERYQSAEALQLALEDWLHTQKGRAGRVELSRYMHDLFPDGVGVEAIDGSRHGAPSTQPSVDIAEAVSEHRTQQAEGARPVAEDVPENLREHNRPPDKSEPPAARFSAADLQHDGGARKEADTADDSVVSADELGELSNTKSRLLAAVGGVGAAVCLIFVVYGLMTSKQDLITAEQKAQGAALSQIDRAEGVQIPEPPAMVEVPLSTEPSGASVVVNGVLADHRTPAAFGLVAGEPNEVTVYHPQYPPQRVIVDGNRQAAPDQIIFSPYDAEPDTGTLVVASKPSAGIVYVDGQRYGATPQTIDDVAAGVDHHVEVRKAGYWKAAGFFEVVAGERNGFQLSLDPTSSAARNRYVNVTYDVAPKSTRVTVNGEIVGSSRVSYNHRRNELLHVELARKHHVDQSRYIFTHGIGSFTLRTFMTKTHRDNGSLSIEVTPSDAKVYVGANSYGTGSVDDLELAEGHYTVVIETPDGSRHEAGVEVYPGRDNHYTLAATSTGVAIDRRD